MACISKLGLVGYHLIEIDYGDLEPEDAICGRTSVISEASNVLSLI